MAAGSTSLRVGFWNTWLLRPLLWPGGPALPFGDRLFAPDVGPRAPLVGAAVRDHFDVIALAECFEEREQRRVAAAWPEAVAVPGPTRRPRRFTGSGLMTMAGPRVTVAHTAAHRYASGGDWRDSDTMASKGVLLTRLRIGTAGTDASGTDRSGIDGPELDLVSTHLIAGGELLPVPGADDTVRHHAARMDQVDELVAFVQRERRPDVPLLLVGDFNISARDPEPRLRDPAERYRELTEQLAPLAVTDLWGVHGIGLGHSCTFTDPGDLPSDPEEPDRVLDDASADPATSPGERIDYLWLAPADDGRVAVQVERPRRWAFTGRDARGGPAGSLSDHLALSVTLTFGG